MQSASELAGQDMGVTSGKVQDETSMKSASSLAGQDVGL